MGGRVGNLAPLGWVRLFGRFLCLTLCFLAVQAHAGLWDLTGDDGREGGSPPWVVQGDETFIDQYHGSFPSARPNGPNSFSSNPENSFSNIFGLQLGFDLGNQGEFWFR
ncbi:MAG: hypothetical protein GJU73_01890, partial [Ferrovum sp.]|nr:hypothetical protein [Ferrovum sp.]